MLAVARSSVANVTPSPPLAVSTTISRGNYARMQMNLYLLHLSLSGSLDVSDLLRRELSEYPGPAVGHGDLVLDPHTEALEVFRELVVEGHVHSRLDREHVALLQQRRAVCRGAVVQVRTDMVRQEVRVELALDVTRREREADLA